MTMPAHRCGVPPRGRSTFFSRLRSLVRAAAASALALSLGGCWSYQSGEQGPIRPAPQATLAESDWPSRDLAPLQDLMAGTPEIVRWVRPPEGVHEDELSEADQRAYHSSGLKITYKAVHGVGLLRVVEPVDPNAPVRADVALMEYIDFLTSGFSPNAYWLTSKTLEGVRDFKARAERFHGVADDEPGIFPAPRPANPSESRLVGDPTASEISLRQGMFIRFPKVASPSSPYCGVILHLNAMFGNEYEVRTLDTFRSRGWAVIDLKPTSQIAPPVPKEWEELAATLNAQRRAITAEICTDIGGAPRLAPRDEGEYAKLASKFRAHRRAPELETISRILARCEQGAFIAGPPGNYPAVASAIAGQLDQAQAGSAYAAEAVMDYVRTNRPDLGGIPVVVMGFSAGGLATPTTAARLLPLLSAAVIIGGGADCFTASQLSKFNNGGLHVRATAEDPLAPAKLTDEQVRLLSTEYLKASKLDPYHTAPLLRELPVLLVTASSDTWVPAECGNLLWERLGKPDRLQIGAGHELLFYFLPGKATFIADWVESHVFHPSAAATSTR